MAQRKQQAGPAKGERTPAKDERIPHSGPIRDNGPPPRVSMTGRCIDAGAAPLGNYTVISQTNGQPDTIRYPKNTGECGPLTLVCLDVIGRPIPGTTAVLEKGHSLRQYSANGGRTHSIAFYCTKKDQGGACQIEFDR